MPHPNVTGTGNAEFIPMGHTTNDKHGSSVDKKPKGYTEPRNLEISLQRSDR